MEAAAAVEAELRRVVEENQRLRGMLEELTRSYGTMYQQLLQVTQQQHHPHRHPDLMMNNRSVPLTTQVSTTPAVLHGMIDQTHACMISPLLV